MDKMSLLLFAAVAAVAVYVVTQKQTQTQVAVVSPAANPVGGKTVQGSPGTGDAILSGILAAFSLGSQIAQSSQKTV